MLNSSDAIELRNDGGEYQVVDRPSDLPQRRVGRPHDGGRLALIAQEARISIPEHIRDEDLTIDVLLALLKAQSPSVAWAPPVNKASLGEPPTQYDHHTQMLVERLIF
ncbi:hypothetical protein [Acetobacter persici]|uniref:Uncharacterized protein n=1 Tax=Acetobacter persici TaxID=1076596 RepID=A0A1U9LIG5_9PROT|nr:hypothetical protein [Acetobacter persici]AQT06236.1 hypothetical protein A0U91_14510 [Acetobacter persici]